MKITTLGIGLAKTVFHLAGLDDKGHEVMKKKVSRKDLAATLQNIPPCRIAMEACGSASFWGRKFVAMGHTVILIPPPSVCEAFRPDKQERLERRPRHCRSLAPSVDSHGADQDGRGAGPSKPAPSPAARHRVLDGHDQPYPRHFGQIWDRSEGLGRQGGRRADSSGERPRRHADLSVSQGDAPHHG